MARFTTDSGMTLTYDELGSGRVLVCIPGGPGLPGRHLGDLGGLDSRFRLVILNPRGAAGSDSPKDPEGYSLDDYVADVEALRAHLGLVTFDLFGHSHGALVAARYAAGHPDANCHVVLDGLPSTGAEVPDSPEGYFFDHDRFGGYIGEIQAGANEAAGEWFFANEWTTRDFASDLAKVRAPSLVVVGEADRIAGPGAAACAASIPDAKLALVPRAGHFAWVENPYEYGRTVLSFLDHP